METPGISDGAAASAHEQAVKTVNRLEKSGVEIQKLVVAVHGIGDQFHQATIQSVVSQFGHHFNVPASVPLGSFYFPAGQPDAFTLKVPPPPPGLAEIGFVEAYWADIPRGVQTEGYRIQESKAWARTIVERVRARYGDLAESECGFKRADFLSARVVLEEMIDTIAVLGNLLFLAEKAGIVKFDLDTLLTSYLGDVQIVADFPNYRAKILAQFHNVIGPLYDELKKRQTDPEIYIVAHSEGTVVAFMALLQAMCAPTEGEEAPPPRPAWIERVRGFMTIGSPIDKHLVLWPSIWDAVKTPGRAPASGPIRWRNYYDHGDPVGFELDTARSWLADPAHDWKAIGAFEFEGRDRHNKPRHDFGFSRYLLPGAAHNDYWTDPAVFGHFIETVMELPPADGAGDFRQPPPDRLVAKIICYVLPYLLTAWVLYAGVYLLFRSMSKILTSDVVRRSAAEDCLAVLWTRAAFHVPVERANDLVDVILNTTGITCLLAAMTLAARIPRLTRAWRWQVVSVGLFVVFASFYVLLVDAPRRAWLGFHAVEQGFHAADAWVPTLRTLALALFSSLLAVWGGRMRAPRWLHPVVHGMRPLLIPGVLSMAFIVVFRLANSEKTVTQSLWPLLLGGAAFVYLWWLAALLFDLVFVWHRYVRHATLNVHFRRLRANEKGGREHRATSRETNG